MSYNNTAIGGGRRPTAPETDKLLAARITCFSQGRAMKAILLFGLVVLAALAGCVGDDEPDPNGGDDGENGDDPGNGGGGDDDDDVERIETSWSLSDLTACDFTVVEGSGSVPCENEFEEIQVEDRERPSTVDDQYLCVDRNEIQSLNFEYWLYWHPTEETYGIYYEYELPEGVTGVDGMIYQESSSTAVTWYDAGASGWIESATLTSEGNARVTIYGHEYETDTPELEGGEVRAYWSLVDGTPYPLQVVSAGEDYYFNNVTVGEGSEKHYKPKSVSLSGSDFNVTVEYTQIIHNLEFNINNGHLVGCGYT